MGLVNRKEWVRLVGGKRRTVGPVRWETRPFRAFFDRATCLRRGCRGEGPFRSGLCCACYERLRVPTKAQTTAERYGERRPLPPGAQHVVGQAILVGGECPIPYLRGAFGRVVRLGDDGALTLVHLTGERIPTYPLPIGLRLRGRYVLFLSSWLLPVDLPAGQPEGDA